MTDVDEILRNPVTRRAFLTRMTAAGLGAAATGLLLAGCGGSSNNPAGSSGGTQTGPMVQFADAKNFPGIPGANENQVVLNYALTLETLEADLYRQAINIAAGKPANTPAPANSDYSSYSMNISSGGLNATQSAVGFLYLQQYAGVEAAHRDFLRTVLGSAAVPANPNGYKANFGTDLHSILTLISAVEEQGVRAYLGAAGFLTDLPTVQVASTIYTAEARHSAGINFILGTNAGLPQQNNVDNGLETGPTPGANGQPAGTDMKVVGADGKPVTYPASNTFEYFNTPSQVLQNIKGFFA